MTVTHPSDVVLGERYRDSISGFEGVATAKSFFLHGCERVTLEHWNDQKQEFSELTFDVPRLIHVATQIQAEDREKKTGGSRPSPTRSTARR